MDEKWTSRDQRGSTSTGIKRGNWGDKNHPPGQVDDMPAAVPFPLNRHDAELLELAQGQLDSIPRLRTRLHGVPLCAQGCDAVHPLVMVAGRPFRHVTIGYGTTRHLAVTEYKPNQYVPDRLWIVVNPRIRRTSPAHELAHAAETVNGCPHSDPHCPCFHSMARYLNRFHGLGIRQFQSCRSEGL